MEPLRYHSLTPTQRKKVRDEYVIEQGFKCMYCGVILFEDPHADVLRKKVNWKLFPGGKDFLRHPIHLQHDHKTGMTEGAVHALCNGVMWQYEGR